MWRTYTGDTLTGLIDVPVDIPSFSWEMDIGDSSLSTTADKGFGSDNVQSLTVPWTAVHCADTPEARSEALAPGRRFVLVCWDDGSDPGSPGVPWLWGVIGQRTDTWADTSFSLDSMMSLMASRVLVRENTFGRSSGGTTQDDIEFKGLSYRGIAANIITMATSRKPGGALPILNQYVGESGTRQKTYHGFNVMNNDVKKLLTAISNLEGGPDMTFRPELVDRTHVALRFVAGSDADRFLAQDSMFALSTFPGGGSMQDVSIAHAGPVMRVYGSGAGQDAAQLCVQAEDLSLVTRGNDPWPLVETAFSGSDDDKLEVLRSHTEAYLRANMKPILQVAGAVDLADPEVPKPGQWWPGELVQWRVVGHPTLPDGDYMLRLMRMSGTESTKVQLTFDVMPDPVY